MVYKIMVVDNEADVVALVKEILEKEGYKVVTAYTGEECLEKLKKNKIDLVLLDVMMPGMSGWAVQERIRHRHSNIKVAFMSVLEFATPEKREMLKKAGLKDFIGKPFNSDDLLNRVKMALGE